MMIPERQLRTVCEESRIGPHRFGRIALHKTGAMMWAKDLRFFVASCREYTLSRTHPDSEARTLDTQITQRRVLFVVSKVSVNTIFMDIEIQIPSTAGDKTNVCVVISGSASNQLHGRVTIHRKSEKYS